MEFSTTSFYRPASNKNARREDNHIVTKGGKTALLADGVSRPYVGEPEDYGDGESSGAAVSRITCDTVATDNDTYSIVNVLIQANKRVAEKHCSMGRDFTKEAVAGASVAGCQISGEYISLITVGDSCIFWQDEADYHSFTNFTPSAAALEEAGNEFFEACKRFGALVKTAPWQLYHPFFQAKQYWRANRNIGKGGHAMVNGNPDLESCWSTKLISSETVKWILLVSDGMLWRDFRPEKHTQLVCRTISQGGVQDLLFLRDALDSQPHITGYPEGTAIVLRRK